MHSVQPPVKMTEYINENIFDAFSGKVKVQMKFLMWGRD